MSEQLPSPDEALKILKESGCSPRVVEHCKAVAELALRIADRCVRNGAKIDIELIRIGGLLHDIGRSKTHSVHHAVAGSEIARSFNLPSSVASIIERHVGGGIAAEEAAELGWPKGIYAPQTLEEKIVTYADKLIEEAKTVPIERTVQKLGEQLGADHPALRRVMNLHQEMSRFCPKASN